MNNAVKNVVIFVSGGAVGVVVARFLFKKKYEKFANQQVEDVKKAFNTYYTEEFNKPAQECTAKVTTTTDTKYTVDSNATKFKTKNERQYYDYTNFYNKTEKSNDIELNNKPLNKHTNDIYIIDDMELNESEYSIITLYWFKDHVLADDDWNVEHDISDTIGDEVLSKLSEENPIMYVRNDKYKIDYEICLSEKYFNEEAPSIYRES